MDNNERFGRLEEVLADVLIEMQGMNSRIYNINEQIGGINKRVGEMSTAIVSLQQGQQEIIGVFNRFVGTVLNKMDEQTAELKGMRQEMKQLYDHEERLRKVEAVVFPKSA
jgi:chromosome segregation ATPase